MNFTISQVLYVFPHLSQVVITATTLNVNPGRPFLAGFEMNLKEMKLKIYQKMKRALYQYS